MNVFTIIELLLQVYLLVIIARVLLTWFPNIDSSNPLIRGVYDITEPVLRPIRELLPQTPGMPIDFSPLVVMVVIQVLLWVLPG
ncbi:MAG: YggT family protein [Armatimonadetes bacterium]|nr:YggT family protein [Anaerolineae bacterium]